MKRTILLMPITALAVALLIVSIAAAQSGGGYALAWYTSDGGGATFSTGGSYSLGGTIGQADAGAIASGGVYALNGGFWPGAAASYNVFLPVVLKG